MHLPERYALLHLRTKSQTEGCDPKTRIAFAERD